MSNPTIAACLYREYKATVIDLFTYEVRNEAFEFLLAGNMSKFSPTRRHTLLRGQATNKQVARS